MRKFASAAVLAFCALTAHSALGATLGLTTGGPSIVAQSAEISFLDFAPNGDLSTSGAMVDMMTGISQPGPLEIGWSIGYALADPTTNLNGGLDVFDANFSSFLTGRLIGIGFTDSVIELQFGNLGGLAAGAFGTSVLAIIDFVAPLGPDPFDALRTSGPQQASITVSNVIDTNPAPVPLPAGGLLLLTGAGGLLMLRRRARR